MMMSKDLPLYRDGRCDKCDRDDWNKLIQGTDPPVYLCSRCRQAPAQATSPVERPVVRKVGTPTLPYPYRIPWYGMMVWKEVW